MNDTEKKDQNELEPKPAETDQEHEEESELGGEMSFLDHLSELRDRMIRMIIGMIIAIIICFNFADTLFYFLMQPVPGFVVENTKRELRNERERLEELVAEQTEEIQNAEEAGEEVSEEKIAELETNKLLMEEARNELINQSLTPATVKIIQTSPIEYIFVMFKVSLVGGIFIAFPYLFYEIWMFVSPGLYKRERKLLIPIIVSSWACFILGGLFCYFFIFRFALAFLVDFAPGFVDQTWILTHYINFLLRMILAFGIVFEEPIVIYLLAKLGFVTAAILRSIRPYAIVGMFGFSALITPPDIFSQIGCGLPLILFYEMSIIVASIIEKKREEEEELA